MFLGTLLGLGITAHMGGGVLLLALGGLVHLLGRGDVLGHHYLGLGYHCTPGGGVLEYLGHFLHLLGGGDDVLGHCLELEHHLLGGGDVLGYFWGLGHHCTHGGGVLEGLAQFLHGWGGLFHLLGGGGVLWHLLGVGGVLQLHLQFLHRVWSWGRACSV